MDELQSLPEPPLVWGMRTHPAHQWTSHFTENGTVAAWIIVEASAWTMLQQAGQITCPAIYAPRDDEFIAAYRWMKSEMAKAGLPSPSPDLTPWWVWVQREPGHRQPYLEDLQGTADPVVLELQLPASELVMSCFDAWHAVLNRWPLYNSPEAEADIEARIRAGGPEAEPALQESWLQVFDLAQLYGDPLGPDARTVQACIWHLRLEHVTRVMPAAELDSLPLS